MNGNPIFFNQFKVHKSKMTCYYYYYLAYKDETASSTTAPGTITTSMINLKPLPSTPSRRTEALNHHRPYRKTAGKSTLNKTDEHCRSLFNLLPTSLRPHHHHQTSNNKGVDAVSMNTEKERARIKKTRSIAS
jgi:hypothetical protein